MSLLSGIEIWRQIGVGAIRIEPLPTFVGPNSADLTLAPELFVYEDPILDVAGGERPLVPVALVDGGWLLKPGRLYLGRTAEYTESHGFVPDVSGRSSVGRLGIRVHATAGWGDDGFCGAWTLEIDCIQPVILRPGIRIAQIRYQPVLGERRPYGGPEHRYQGQRGVVGSRL